MSAELGPGATLLQRGWLSANNLLLHDGEGGAVLVDSGHCVHAAQTVELVRHALAGARLARVINTHLHSDHCGGNAALQREFGCAVFTPPGHFDAVQAWDEATLGYGALGQRCERFTAQGRIEPGQVLRVGARQWQVHAAPGHDPHSVLLFDDERGVLVSADALWEHGFGVVFPELEGESAFDEVAAVLSLIESLPVRLVVPGHGAPFTDVAAALQRARSRLAGFVAQPSKHRLHAAKVLLKYHLLEEGQQALDALQAWAEAAPLLGRLADGLGHGGPALWPWVRSLVDDMAASGALALREGTVFND